MMFERITLARRKKKDDHIVEKLIKKADEARKTGIALSKIAAEEARIRGTKLTKAGREKISEGIYAAKKMSSSPEEDLRTLEKLGKLKKTGLITEREFQEKKKEILKRI